MSLRVPVRVRNLVAVLVLVSGVDVCRGQGVFLEPSESAVEVSCGGLISSDRAGLNIGLGYSFGGMLDFGLSAGRNTSNEDEVGTNLSERLWGPNIGVFLLKQSDYIPLSVGLLSSYRRSSVSGEVLDLLGWRLNGTFWYLGGSASKLIHLSEQTDFIPSFGISHVWSKAEIRDVDGGSRSGKDRKTAFSVAFAYAFAMGEGSSMYLKPEVSFGEDDPVFSINLGLFARTTPNRQQTHAYDPTAPRGEPRGRHEWGQTELPPPQPYAQPKPAPVPPPVTSPPPAIGDEQVSTATLELLKGGTPEMTDTEISNLGTEQVAAISRIFKVPTSIIHTYRWARSMAPAGHPNAGTVLFSIEYGDQTFNAKETIRVDADGFVVERSKK